MKRYEDKVYVLNPDYILRKDLYRVALYSQGEVSPYSSGDWNSFVHPVQAIIWSFFTYKRTFVENIRLISSFFRKEEEEIKKLLYPYLENSHPIRVVWQGNVILLPKNLLIPIEKTNHKNCFPELNSEKYHCKKVDLHTKRFYSGPLLVTFMLTNSCITKCKYCYADTVMNVRRLLSTKRILELIDEASRLQVKQINLIGGEIFYIKIGILY